MFDTVLAEGHSDIGPAAAAGSGATAAAEYFTASHTIIYCMLAYHNFLKTLTIYFTAAVVASGVVTVAAAAPAVLATAV